MLCALCFREQIIYFPSIVALLAIFCLATMSRGDAIDDYSMSGYDNAGRGITFGRGGTRLVSMNRGRGVSVGPVGNVNDLSVINSPLNPVTSSTPITQSVPISTSTPVSRSNPVMLSSPSGHVTSSAPGAEFVPPHVQDPPPTQVITTEAFSNLITDLAKQIGENITASLSTMHQRSGAQPEVSGSQPASVDTSQLRVVVQSDAKAPPYFRGDKADMFSIHEWEDMMKCYMRRMDCRTQGDMFELVMSRLTGRARDVVRVSLRSRPGLDTANTPAAVFDILKSNFGELAYSNLPMRDFYSTVPRAGESAMDYWIRLNKSIDAADECLRRRGKSVEDPSAEVVLMFVSHCPDPGLAMSFQLKAPEQWTAAEVQERLDSHMRSLRRTAVQPPHVLTMSAHSQRPVDASPLCSPPIESQPAPVAHHLASAYGQSQPNTAVMGQHQLPVSYPQSLTPAVAPVPVTAGPPAADPGVQQVVAMFDKVLSLCTASLAQGQRPPDLSGRSHQQGRSRQSGQPQQRSQPSSCRVCGSGEHSTHMHCRLYRLCLNCYCPGHMRHECTQSTQPPAAQAPPASGDSN